MDPPYSDYAEVGALPPDLTDPTGEDMDAYYNGGKTVFFAEPVAEPAVERQSRSLVFTAKAGSGGPYHQQPGGFRSSSAQSAQRSSSARPSSFDAQEMLRPMDQRQQQQQQQRQQQRPSSASGSFASDSRQLRSFSLTSSGYSSTASHSFQSSFPVNERRIPKYDPKLDPHCTRYHKVDATTAAEHVTNENALASAARQQSNQLKLGRERSYRKAMAQAQAKAQAEHAYHDAIGQSHLGFHPAGFGFRPNLGVAPPVGRSARERAAAAAAFFTQPPPPPQQPPQAAEHAKPEWQHAGRVAYGPAVVANGGGSARDGSARGAGRQKGTRRSLLDQMTFVPSKAQYAAHQQSMHAPRGVGASLGPGPGVSWTASGAGAALYERPAWDDSIHKPGEPAARPARFRQGTRPTGGGSTKPAAKPHAAVGRGARAVSTVGDGGSRAASFGAAAAPAAGSRASSASKPLSVPNGSPFVSRVVYLYDRLLTAKKAETKLAALHEAAPHAAGTSASGLHPGTSLEVRVQIGSFQSADLNRVEAEPEPLPTPSEVRQLEARLEARAGLPTRLKLAEVLTLLEAERRRVHADAFLHAGLPDEAEFERNLLTSSMDASLAAIVQSGAVSDGQFHGHAWSAEDDDSSTRCLERLLDNLRAANPARSSQGHPGGGSPSAPGSPDSAGGGSPERLAARGARAGEYSSLSAEDLAAFASVAEAETSAALGASETWWKGSELKRTGQEAVQRALRAAQYEPHAPPALAAEAKKETLAARADVEALAKTCADAMRARVTKLWQALSLDAEALAALWKDVGAALASSEEEEAERVRQAAAGAEVERRLAAHRDKASPPPMAAADAADAAASTSASTSATAAASASASTSEALIGMSTHLVEHGALPPGAPDALAATFGVDAAFAPSAALAAVAAAKAAVAGPYPVVHGAVLGAECAQLASVLLALRLHAERTLLVTAAITQREALCRHLRLSCARLAPMHAASTRSSRLDTVPGTGTVAPARGMVSCLEAEVVSTVALLRQATVRVVEAVSTWRGGLTTPAPVVLPARIAARGGGAPAAPGRALEGAPSASGVMLSGLRYAAPSEVSLHAPSAAPLGGNASLGLSNYMRQMATDLDGLADESAEMRRLLNSAPSRLDGRRLWRARQAISLEPHAQRRFELAGGRPALHWVPLASATLLATEFAEGAEAGGIVELLSADDDELLNALRC